MPVNELVMIVEAGMPDEGPQGGPASDVRDATQEDIERILM